MFTLWYLVLGYKEYKRGKCCCAGTPVCTVWDPVQGFLQTKPVQSYPIKFLMSPVPVSVTTQRRLEHWMSSPLHPSPHCNVENNCLYGRTSLKAERTQKGSDPVRQLPKNDDKISGLVKPFEIARNEPVQPKIPDSKPEIKPAIPETPKNILPEPKTPESFRPDTKPKTPDTPKNIIPEPKTPESFRPDTKPKTPDTPKNILPQPKTPESFRPDTKPKTPDTPKNILPEPKTPESFRPDTKPKTPDTPKNILPEPKTPESFRPDTKPKTPDTPKNIIPEPKTPETPKNVLPEPKTPESPKPTTPGTAVAPEIPKREPPKVPNRRQEPPRTPESPKPITRDDEMLGRQFNRSPGINGAGPRQSQPDPKDLSYSAHEVAKPFRESALSFTQRERSVPSNPDSLEASEEED